MPLLKFIDMIFNIKELGRKAFPLNKDGYL